MDAFLNKPFPSPHNFTFSNTNITVNIKMSALGQTSVSVKKNTGYLRKEHKNGANMECTFSGF